jgi:hypothetical protein
MEPQRFLMDKIKYLPHQLDRFHLHQVLGQLYRVRVAQVVAQVAQAAQLEAVAVVAVVFQLSLQMLPQ